MKDRNDLIRNIFAKAKNDIGAARFLLNAERPATDVICFHCQQAVEKYLKAWLHFQQSNVPRTHNLRELLAICETIDGEFRQISGAASLTQYAVEVRYADDFYMPSFEEARSAVDVANNVENFIIRKFGDFDLALPEQHPE